MFAFHQKIYTDGKNFYTAAGAALHSKRAETMETLEAHDLETGAKVICTYRELFTDWDSLIICNDLPEHFPEIWENIENGELNYTDEDGEEHENAVYQWYIISESTADNLKMHTDEIVAWCPTLDLYLLGVTHCGTGWDAVCATIEY